MQFTWVKNNLYPKFLSKNQKMNKKVIIVGAGLADQVSGLLLSKKDLK